MIDLNRNNDVKCSACGSDFVEAMQSVHDNPIQNARVEEAPESPAFSRPLTAPVQRA